MPPVVPGDEFQGLPAFRVSSNLGVVVMRAPKGE